MKSKQDIPNVLNPLELRELEYSEPVDLNQYDTRGFAIGYPLRKHKNEQLAIDGTNELRRDWHKIVGPLKHFGCHNPKNGHCCALLFPLCKPERLFWLAYIIEFVFLYDHVLESGGVMKPMKRRDDWVGEVSRHLSEKQRTGVEMIKDKIVRKLKKIDSSLAEDVVDGWEEMERATSRHDKKKVFQNLDEYVDYRVIDAGAP